MLFFLLLCKCPAFIFGNFKTVFCTLSQCGPFLTKKSHTEHVALQSGKHMLSTSKKSEFLQSLLILSQKHFSRHISVNTVKFLLVVLVLVACVLCISECKNFEVFYYSVH